MFTFLLIIAFAMLLLIVALYFFRRLRKQRIDDIVTDPNSLASWTYSPAEWQKAVADEFTWANAAECPAQIYFSQTAFCVRTSRRDRLFDLTAGIKMVTFASFSRHPDGGLLKLRVRWRIVHDQMDSTQTKYYKEDYRIPVPQGQEEAAQRVADHFTAQLQNNLETYSGLVSDDEPISLFGKDSF
jgi:hypothetical protein